MHTEHIYIEGFRNYREVNILFDPGISIICGKNAQGKTNLLEAIYYLSCGRSFRTRHDRELINFNSSFAHIKGKSCSENSNDTNISISISSVGKKKIIINDVVKKTMSELSGILCAVLFLPNDLEIVRGPAAQRRRLMDMAICQLKPRYANALSEYKKIYDHKTRILRDYREKPSLLEILDDFNMKMAKTGAEIAYYRSAWCARLSNSASTAHSEISGGKEHLGLTYKLSGSDEHTEGLKPSDIFEILKERQKTRRQTEIDASLCLTGIHKDDIAIKINGNNAKEYASQGQIRTCALSIKLAEREICFNDKGEYPVLLLDDVLSELDPGRQDFVLNKITGGQVLITCCDPGTVGKIGRIITVEDGRVY